MGCKRGKQGLIPPRHNACHKLIFQLHFPMNFLKSPVVHTRTQGAAAWIWGKAAQRGEGGCETMPGRGCEEAEHKERTEQGWGWGRNKHNLISSPEVRGLPGEEWKLQSPEHLAGRGGETRFCRPRASQRPDPGTAHTNPLDSRRPER